jgi:hypothetical protein
VSKLQLPQPRFIHGNNAAPLWERPHPKALADDSRGGFGFDLCLLGGEPGRISAERFKVMRKGFAQMTTEHGLRDKAATPQGLVYKGDHARAVEQQRRPRKLRKQYYFLTIVSVAHAVCIRVRC